MFPVGGVDGVLLSVDFVEVDGGVPVGFCHPLLRRGI